MERNKSCSIYSTPWSRTVRVYSTPGVDLERNKCYSGVDPRLLQLDIVLLYHCYSVFLITMTVFSTHFPHRNSKNRHYETNIISKLATFENSWEKLIIPANFWVIRGLMASHDPKICTHCECFPHSFSRGRAIGK